MSKETTKTVCELSEYKGSPVIGIWAVNENGEKTGSFPIISFGKAKAKALIDHHNDIKIFLESIVSVKEK